MGYQCGYKTPDGFSDLVMRSDGAVLTGLWFEKTRDERKHPAEREEKGLEIFRQTRDWLDLYFGGGIPDFTPEYRLENATDFRREVSELMHQIPYGEVVTYGSIAEKIAEKNRIPKMSAQAIGGAVGWNPICIIIPCHRVVGSNHSLTGYGGGIHNKISLLKLEGINMDGYFVPKKGSAL